MLDLSEAIATAGTSGETLDAGTLGFSKLGWSF
jgi:hypothetical protein